MKITLVRHGKTQSNQEHRYLGWTDELLCREGIALLLKKMRKGLYPQSPDRVVCSPMRRCIQTAAWICPKGYPYRIEDNLRETNFGIFEGKTYEELKGDLDYQRWLASNGEGPIPQGESRMQMCARCLAGFERQVDCALQEGKKELLFVVHGGSIMAILERYAQPAQPFYAFHVDNGDGYILEIPDGQPLHGRYPVQKLGEEENK